MNEVISFDSENEIDVLKDQDSKEAYQYMKSIVKEHYLKKTRQADIGHAQHSLTNISFAEHLKRIEGQLDSLILKETGSFPSEDYTGEYSDTPEELNQFHSKYPKIEGEHEEGYTRTSETRKRAQESSKGDDPEFRRNRIQGRLDDLLEQGMSIMKAYDILADEFEMEDLDLL